MRLSRKQLEVFSEIESYVAEHSYAPSIRELCKAFNLKSTSTIHGYLHRLRDHGLIDWQPDMPRTLRIVGSVKTSDVVLYN